MVILVIMMVMVVMMLLVMVVMMLPDDGGANDGGANIGDDSNDFLSIIPSQYDCNSSFCHILWSNAMSYTICCITTTNH